MLRLRVKEVARQKGMSMHKLSLRSEVSYHVIREIFNNPVKIISTDTLNRIAKALGVPVTEIIEDVPEEDVTQGK
ncbi:XRE family transcriptional regulator [Ktedonosporobacter rubrisoli]|uniref:XRE family transcriptional regulator n=1 Tax=Ktedonosporobacter rubrisoli TaxID=2509675 RepID=A0A4P6JT98_KTERU|nr:helix-turn-helix transcriptional regulator [Ktedonosporobacter rubrisoli]QBD78510.1 XRE family transcriptional regulator [Ktedonosporobacter rubrisoli]